MWTIFFFLLTLVRVGHCIDKVLFTKEKGVYVKGSVIRTERAENEFECGAFCNNEPSCVSVNFKISGDDQGRCDLNSKTLRQSQENGCFKHPEYNYLEVVKQECPKKPFDPLHSSLILGEKYEYVTQLTTWLNGEKNWRLCYRGTRDGWEGRAFHTNCDGKGPTVTIVGVGQYIFGAYSPLSWGGSGYEYCSTCFLFSFQNKDSLPPFKATNNGDHGIMNNPNYGPTFGGGHDLHISDNADTLPPNSYAKLGYSYHLPSGYISETNEARSLLGGSIKFIPTEVEVFYLDD